MNQPVKRVPYFTPGTEVAGGVLYGFVANLKADRFQPFLAEKNLTDIDPNEWYPIEMLMDVFEKMKDDMMSFVALGISIAEHGAMPEGMEIPTLEEMLIAWDDHYQANHRNGEVTHALPTKVKDGHYTIELQTNHTYPFDLVYGLAHGFCQQLLPQGTPFIVEYDEQHSPYVTGAKKILVHVMWGDATK